MTNWIIFGEGMTAQVAAQPERAAVAAMLHQVHQTPSPPVPARYPTPALGRGNPAASCTLGEGGATSPAVGGTVSGAYCLLRGRCAVGGGCRRWHRWPCRSAL